MIFVCLYSLAIVLEYDLLALLLLPYITATRCTRYSPRFLPFVSKETHFSTRSNIASREGAVEYEFKQIVYGTLHEVFTLTFFVEIPCGLVKISKIGGRKLR